MSRAFSLQNINLSFGSTTVLENVNLEIEQKEFLGIIGPNGGGKTTLLKVLLGLVKPDSGKVNILGDSIKKNRKYLGYVPQYSNFTKDYPISVKEVVRIGSLSNKEIDKKEVYNLIDQSLEKVNLLHLKDRVIGELSGGEKQRVLIARALATNPKILFLDEPTASVDATSGHNFYELMHQLNHEITIVLVSHDIGAVSQYVKKIACLNKKLVFHNSKEISADMLEDAYQCPVDLIAHGVPHRVLNDHCEC